MTRLQEMTKEAICSALYSMGDLTRFLGESADLVLGVQVAWFRLSNTPEREHVDWRTDPRFIVVNVREDVMDLVVVTVDWVNVSAGADSVVMGQQIFRIPTADVPEAQLRMATEEVLLRVLAILEDVIKQEGVAGPIEDLAPESAAGDEDDEDDLAVQD